MVDKDLEAKIVENVQSTLLRTFTSRGKVANASLDYLCRLCRVCRIKPTEY